MYPLSLSVTEMIKLGKFNKASSSAATVVKIFEYDIKKFSWSKVPTVVEFIEENPHFAQAGFRKTNKASSKNPMYPGVWVIKRYLPHAIKGIFELQQTLEEHTRKTVQMHMLAKNFTLQLEKKVQELKMGEVFGDVPKYSSIYYGETEKEEYVTVESYIDGKFVKYTNNTGEMCVSDSDVNGQKCECLSHFSFEKSDHQVMLVDVQGSGNKLFVPEIASAKLLDEDDHVLYCAGNLSKEAMKTFISQHKCNRFCEAVALSPLNMEMFSNNVAEP